MKRPKKYREAKGAKTKGGLVQISVRLDEPVFNKVNEIALYNNMSFSEACNNIVRKAVNEKGHNALHRPIFVGTVR